MAVTLIEVERALTYIFAEWLNMTLDVDIFRGVVPEDKFDVVGVYLLDDIQENETFIPVFNFQVNGKFKDRDLALNMCNVFRTKLPAFGLTMNGVKISEILKLSGGQIVPLKSDGSNTFEVFISGFVYFRD